jgi:hypothetical protein
LLVYLGCLFVGFTPLSYAPDHLADSRDGKTLAAPDPLSGALAPPVWAAIVCVMVACAGAARGAAEPGPAAESAAPPPP